MVLSLMLEKVVLRKLRPNRLRNHSNESCTFMVMFSVQDGS